MIIIHLSPIGALPPFLGRIRQHVLRVKATRSVPLPMQRSINTRYEFFSQDIDRKRDDAENKKAKTNEKNGFDQTCELFYSDAVE